MSRLRTLYQRARQSALVYGLASTAVRVGSNLILIPLVVTRLSETDQALWWSFVALGNLTSLVDFGFGQAIARVYSYLWAGAEDFDTEGLRPPPQNHQPNLPRIRQLTVTVQRLYLYLAGLALLLLAGGGSLALAKSLSGSPAPLQAWASWGAYLLAAVYGLATSRWQLACQGLNQVRPLQAAYMWSGLAYLATAGLLLWMDVGLASMAVAVALRGVLARGLARWAYLAVVPPAPDGPATPDPTMLRRLWPNARKFGLMTVGACAITNSSVLISGNLLGPEITASYGLTAAVGNFLISISTLWLVVKWPGLTILRTQGKVREMSVIFAQRLALTAATFVVGAVFLALLGNWALEFKGAHSRLLATPLLVVYLLYLGGQLVYVQFGTLALTENEVPFAKVSLFTGLSLVAASLLMTHWLGLWGLLLAPPLVEGAYSAWFTLRRGFRGQSLTVREFWRAALHRRL